MEPFWGKADLKGRCWGPKGKGGQYTGTNITFAVGEELVSISKNGDGLEVHEFARASKTKLGSQVKEILRKKKIL